VIQFIALVIVGAVVMRLIETWLDD